MDSWRTISGACYDDLAVDVRMLVYEPLFKLVDIRSNLYIPKLEVRPIFEVRP
jgi:hypothetical protein